ncbi:lipoprotein-releasing ABC transporter permease subunit [Parvularcula oceani]|uniref:lipoprotein-releasing ABC transporter permease subunit n=1 Tax=Parvularcula oceani TaxID=1247963 RepID=UPI0004E2075D|nr:lipoprotein-releasing ABC transporter permease subunit [Parvularcula oceani]
MSTTATAPLGTAKPFGAFEWMVARRYLGATRRGGGVSFITLVAFAGIALSVATLLIVMAVMQGFRTTLLDQLLGVNGHVFVQSMSLSFDDYDELAERIEGVPGVERVTPVLRVEAGMSAGDTLTAALVQGVAPEALRMIDEVSGPDHLVAGSFEDFGAGRNGGDEIAIGFGLAQKLGVSAGDPVTLIVSGGAETPMGTQPFREKTYRVGAVFVIGNSEYDQVYAYMPLEQAQLLTRNRGEVSEIEVRVADPQDVRAIAPLIGEAAGPGTLLRTWQDRFSSFFNALQVERSMVRIILSLLVLVAALLIVSGLVMLVKDKKSDIAVLRTMGATRSAVLRIFFTSGMMIGVGGTALGVVLGTLFVANITAIERILSTLFGIALFNPEIYYLSEIPAELQWGEAGFVIVWTLILSAAASLFPAWQAARLDPVEALRYE